MGVFVRNINFGGNFKGIFPQAPEASFNANPTRGSTGTLTVAFTDTSTGSPTSWLWDFKNDGTATSTSQNPTYTYTTPGTYSVKLTATNAFGVSSTATRTNLISFALPPTASFTGTPRSGQPPLAVTFTDTSTGSPTAWAWDFTNDGTTDSTVQNPTYTYSSTGTYTVKMTASSEWGSSTSTQVNYITVSDAPPPPSDQYFAYTVLELPGTGANNTNNNTFVDSSSNNFAITRVGNTTQGSFSPFSTAPGYWSNYFDGSGDYLSLPSAQSSLYLTGAFTWEAWVYPTSTNTMIMYGNFANAFGDADRWSFVSSPAGSFSNGLKLFWYRGNYGLNQTALGSTTGLTLNTWNHVAIVRNASNNITIYLNGVSLTLTTYNENITWSNSFSFTNPAPISINGGPDYATGAGFISNLRFVNGTAVYTTNFTPSTTPLTAISGTSLLTCQSNRYIDNSSNNFTLTRNGDTSVSAFGPFIPTSSYDAATAGGSMYFDGSGDSLSRSFSSKSDGMYIQGTTYTVECWVNPLSSAGMLIYTTAAFNANYFGSWHLAISGSTISVGYRENTGSQFSYTQLDFTASSSFVGKWTHIAISVSNGSVKCFVNGVQTGSTQSISAMNFTPVGGALGTWANGYNTPGDFYNGYISNFRIVQGVAVYTTNFTPPTAPVSAISGTSLLLNGTNAAIYDATVKTNVETLGDAKVSTTISANGSMYFDGSGDYLTMPSSPNYVFGTGNFTVEFWMYPTSLSNCSVFDIRLPSNTTGAGFEIYIWQSKLSAATPDQNWISGYTLTTNTWYHVALTRSGNSIRVFVNGVQTDNPFTINYNFTNNIIRIGQGQISGNFAGYMNDIRVTKGIARYTGNFTPPTRS